MRYRLQFFFDFPQPDLPDRVHQNRQLCRTLGLAETIQTELRLPDLRGGDGIDTLTGVGVKGGIRASATG